MINITKFFGILGVMLFVLAAIAGTLLMPNYSHLSQYLSESYATGTQYSFYLRALGYIPSGIFLTLFFLCGLKFLPNSNKLKIGFIGLGIFYGIATILVGIYPCDFGCNREWINPSSSQIIHNLVGFSTYVVAPVCFLLIGIGLKDLQLLKKLSIISIITAIWSFIFILLLLGDANGPLVGLYQRFIEGAMLPTIFLFAISMKKLTLTQLKNLP